MSTDATREIRPREQEAMDIWKSLPESERSYDVVADRMNITPGRAGVYVRDALLISGEEHLLPQRGRKSGNGGNARPMVSEDENPINDLKRLLAQVDERAKALADRLAEADKAASEFDPAQAVVEEQERLDKIAAEATASAEAFKSDTDAQTAWATKVAQSLVERKTTVENDVAARTATLTKKRDGLAQIIALAEENPDLAAMFASTVSDEEAENPEALSEPAEGDDADDEDAS